MTKKKTHNGIGKPKPVSITKNSKNVLNPRQELFAIEIANGVTAADAYRIVYGQGNYSDESLYQVASRMRLKVDSRVREILEKRALNSVEDRNRCNAVLMNIVNANPKRTMYTDPKTGKIKMRTPQQLADDTADAISDMTNNKGYVSYHFHGKIEAIRLLAQMNGWNAPAELNVKNTGSVLGELRIGFDDEEE